VPAAALILFFTYRVSLRTWAERGILDREVALYRRLLGPLSRVGFVTYGVRDRDLRARVAPIEVLPRPRGLNDAAMSLLAPLVYRRRLREASVLKSNQTAGAWTAALAKRITGTPLIVRSGYSWSANRARETSAGRHALIVRLERLAVRAADRVLATSSTIADDLVRTHGLDRTRVRVVPNHVATDRFAPDGTVAREKGLVVYVGRLSPEKNLPALVDAVARVPGARLKLVGDGDDRPQIEAAAARARVDVDFAGTVPNETLPALLNQAEVFVLPSRYEGQPKAVLEAMACGVPVLGADAAGIRDLITHGETGWLASGDAAGLADGLRALLSDPPLRARLAASARDAVVARHSLDAVAAAELAVIDEVVR
jgi:glycosyltransferase involved in cell wall biosynthesis